MRYVKARSNQRLDAKAQKYNESGRRDRADKRYEDIISVRRRAIGRLQPDFSCMLLHTETQR